ncbi:GDSL-type esterase/lipase family protein [Bacteroidota bacterium]
MKKILIILSLVLFSFVLNAQEIIRVACVGNSITYGSGIKDRENKSYPAVLGKMLGDKWQVINFGVGGRTLLSKGDFPYIFEKKYTDALNFQPDIVIIKLGTNDTKPQNWKFKRNYISDYIKLIKSFKKLKSKPVIYICKAVPAFKLQWGINPDIIKNEINPAIEKIAKKTKTKIINLYTPFLNDKSLFPDFIHPDEKGAEKMAKIIYNEIKK